MHSRNKLLNLKYKTTTFFVETVKIYLYVKLLIILLSGKILFNSYMMKTITTDEKVLIDRLKINTGKTTYMQRSNLMYSHIKSFSAITLLDLKKHDILFG